MVIIEMIVAHVFGFDKLAPQDFRLFVYICTGDVSQPPSGLLMTLMSCGFTGQLNSPSNSPAPLSSNEPMTSPVEATVTQTIELGLIKLASTLSSSLSASYSARSILTTKDVLGLRSEFLNILPAPRTDNDR